MPCLKMGMLIHNKKKGFILRIVNSLTGLMQYPWKIFSKEPDLSKLIPAKILMIRLDHIGDVVMTSPAFTSLRQRFPQSKIVLLTDSVGAQLFANDPGINDVLVFNWPWVHQKKNNRFTTKKVRELFKIIRHLRRQKFDLLVEFRGDLRFVLLFGVLTGAKIRVSNSRCGESSLLHASSGYDLSKHEVERSLEVLDCFGEISHTVTPKIFLNKPEISALKEKLEAETGKSFPAKLAVIAPYSSKDVKSWPSTYFREVIAHLSDSGFTVMIAGTKDDQGDASSMIRDISGEVFSFAGKTSIRELAALVSMANIVVGVDTGVLHIAACFNVPIIAIFGATRSMEFRPYSPLARVLETNTCQCNQFLHDKCDVPVEGYAKCLAELSPARVIESINQVVQDQTILNK